MFCNRNFCSWNFEISTGTSLFQCVIVFVKLKAPRVSCFWFLSLFLFITILATKKSYDIHGRHKLPKFWRNFNYLGLSWSVVTVIFWICAWLILLWKDKTCFKPLYMILARELIKNLHAATFASMLAKSSGLLYEAERGPFSICKNILSIFWGWKRFSFKYAEAKQKINHTCKKGCKVCVPNKTEDLNISMINEITGINELKTLRHTSCKCMCKFDGRKCNSN